ncbi:MAG: hypothetical protein ACQETI_09370 [Halobacteriota archaeon]
MAAIEALQLALSSLRRNPVLFLGGLLLGVVLVPQSALQLAGVPLVPTLLQVLTFFVTPFVIAGIVGMADESLDGETTFGTLTSTGRDRYLPLLFGKFIEFAINVAFGIVAVIVAVFALFAVGLGATAGGGFDAGAIGLGTIALVGGVFLLLVLAYLVVVFFIQFFPVAIVVDETDVVEGFTTSYRTVRANLLSTFVYSIIQFAVGVLVSLPFTGFILFRTIQNAQNMSQMPGGPAAPGAGQFGALSLFSTPEVVAISLISLAMTMILSTFQLTYAVAFWDRVDATTREQSVSPDSPSEPMV